MITIYDKAQWHIDAGEAPDVVIGRLKVVFDFLEKKDFLSLEGKEVWNLGIDSSISLNERMVSEEGNRFLTDCYDDIIGLDSSVMAVELEKRYSDYVIEDER